MDEMDRKVEEAAATLGNSRFQTIARVLLNGLAPAVLTGLALAFAHSVGEYGSVIFIAGNLPFRSEMAPLLIVIKLKEYNYAAAMAIAAIMLVISFAAARHQSQSRVSAAVDMKMVPEGRDCGTAPAIRSAVTEARATRFVVIGITLAFLGLMLFLPMFAVFVKAFCKGAGPFLEGLAEYETLSAIRLMLIVAAISEPLYLVFGVAAAWAIAKFDFKGKAFLTTLIDLLFLVSPVIYGLVFAPLFSANGLLGQWLSAHKIKIFAVPGLILATMFDTFSFVARELIPLMQERGTGDEEAALLLAASGWQTFRYVTLSDIR
jgi:ABC-type sulfate transport system permease subunit